MNNEFNQFVEAYINEMIQAERELEKEIFHDNMSPMEKAMAEWVKKLSEGLANEIDKRILDSIYDLSHTIDHHINDISVDNNIVNIRTVVNPTVQVINLDFIITSNDVTFEP